MLKQHCHHKWKSEFKSLNSDYLNVIVTVDLSFLKQNLSDEKTALIKLPRSWIADLEQRRKLFLTLSSRFGDDISNFIDIPFIFKNIITFFSLLDKKFQILNSPFLLLFLLTSLSKFVSTYSRKKIWWIKDKIFIRQSRHELWFWWSITPLRLNPPFNSETHS